MSQPRLMVAERIPRKRTDAIKQAIITELEAIRIGLDAQHATRSVVVTVKMKQHSTDVRTVIVTVETERSME